MKRFKMDAKRYQQLPTWSQKGAIMSQGAFKNTTYGTGTTSISFGKKYIKFRFLKRLRTNMDLDAKGMPKLMPKLIKTNAKIGSEKDMDNHEQSCFSKWRNCQTRRLGKVCART